MPGANWSGTTYVPDSTRRLGRRRILRHPVGDAGLLGCAVGGRVVGFAHAAAITSTPSEATCQIGFRMIVVLSA